MDTIFYPFDHLDRLFPKLKTCNQKGILARLAPLCCTFFAVVAAQSYVSTGYLS